MNILSMFHGNANRSTMESMNSEIDESKFNLWRGVVALAHVDGRVLEEEASWIRGMLIRLPFTDEQRATLESDIDNEGDIEAILNKITDRKDKATLLHFANMLFKVDGHFDCSEKATFKKIEEKVLQNSEVSMAIQTFERMAKDGSLDEDLSKKPRVPFDWLLKIFSK